MILPDELASGQMPQGQGGSDRTVTPVTVPGSPGITDFSQGQGEPKLPSTNHLEGASEIFPKKPGNHSKIQAILDRSAQGLLKFPSQPGCDSSSRDGLQRPPTSFKLKVPVREISKPGWRNWQTQSAYRGLGIGYPLAFGVEIEAKPKESGLLWFTRKMRGSRVATFC